MGKTTQVASDRAFDQTKTVLPAEVARGVHIQNPPSLRALKLMHLMIGTAGGRMADDVQHQMRLSDIRKISGMAHHDRESLKPLFIELQTTVISYDEPEKQRWVVGGLLDEAQVDYRHEVSGDLLVSWYFGRTFRRLAEASCHWAILDRQTVFALSSKYSVLLFQYIASMANLDRIDSKTFDIGELRAVLGVAEGKLGRFADLNRRALQPSIAEINQTSRLTLTSTPNKVGRTVASVTISWAEKELDQKRETKRELDRPKVGRKARREGRVEMPVVAFPETGSLTYSPRWQELKRQAGCNMDNGMIADKFRRFLNERRIPFDAGNIEKLFTDFCAKVGKV